MPAGDGRGECGPRILQLGRSRLHCRISSVVRLRLRRCCGPAYRGANSILLVGDVPVMQALRSAGFHGPSRSSAAYELIAGGGISW